MLPKDFWKSYEPRVIFPVFDGVENTFDFVVQENLNGGTWKDVLRPAYYFYKKQKSLDHMLRNYWWMLTGKKIKFRGAFLSRDGELIKAWDFPGSYGKGDVFSVNVNQWLKDSGIPLKDGEFLLIANRGMMNVWSSSPGNMTSRYVGPNFIGGFRTGFFARPLNATKAHFGFTGLNPKILLTDDLEPSLLLINHSSNPQYDQTAEPKVRLYRNATEYLEADFGAIPPLGIREKKITDLFPNAQEFLKPSGGIGHSITKVTGITLASIHILRSKSGKTMAFEHSRPAHAAVVNYMAVKNYKVK